MEADALATALAVLGPGDGEALAKTQGIPALFFEDGSDGIGETMTGGFADRGVA